MPYYVKLHDKTDPIKKIQILFFNYVKISKNHNLGDILTIFFQITYKQDFYLSFLFIQLLELTEIYIFDVNSYYRKMDGNLIKWDLKIYREQKTQHTDDSVMNFSHSKETQ